MEHAHHNSNAHQQVHEHQHHQHTHSSEHKPGKLPHDHDQMHVHDKHAGHHTTDFLKRFWICVVLTLPVLLLSHMIQQWLGYKFHFPGDSYVLVGLSAVIYFYGGMPFLKSMITDIRDRAIGMMTLVALAITVAFLYSVAVVFGLPGMDFFWELATLVDIMLLGHWLEMRSQMAASKALESLVSLLPATVHVEREAGVVDINVQDLKNNDIILIKPGEKIAADGKVLEGTSYVNESMLTGESVPVKKAKESKVIAGSLNGDGSLRIQVTGAGKDSYLNKVITLVQSAQSTKSRTQNIADKVAGWLTIISILVGLATFLYWYIRQDDMAFALERLVTVMVTSCPHALGVAIPLVVALSTTRAATSGLLIRNRSAFEKARKVTTIIFDKTGTLTKGSHEVQKIIPLNSNYSAAQLLQYAAAVQQNSEHYIAKGVLRKLQAQALPLWHVTDFHYEQGIGVSGNVNGKIVVAAGPNYFTSHHKAQPKIPGDVDESNETVNFLLIDNEVAGLITLADTIRETSRQAIADLKQMHIKSFLLTGDNETIAAAIAGTLKMDGYSAGVLPHQKQEKVKAFQEKGEVVAMTGDGVNDAPALAQADVGIAIGSGTDVAAETADILLVNSDPKDVVSIITFGRKTYRKMIQNLFWAVGYNVVAIPLAAGVLYPTFTLTPAMGAVLMSLSTVVVAINARLLHLEK